jgi:hypothetical protein
LNAGGGIVVYTAIAGDYDPLKSLPAAWREEATCIAYLENPEPGDWQIRRIESADPDPCRRAKKPKVHPEDLFREFACSIWIDGSVRPKEGTSPARLVEQALRGCDIALFRHRTRHCIFDEAEACIQAGKDRPEIIERQMRRYRRDGYPRGFGLNECTVLVRRHSSAIGRFCAAWHAEIERGSKRDQLSFNYVAWKQNLKCGALPGNIIANPYFTWYYHQSAGAGPLVPVQ